MFTYIEPYTLKLRLWMIHLSFALGVIGIIIVESKGNIDNEGNKIFLIMMALVYGVIYFIITRNKISVDEDGITQSSLFIKNRKLLWNEIISSEVIFRFRGKSGQYRWETKDKNGKSIAFSVSMYSRSELKIFADALSSKCPDAITGERTIKISQGNFPWYIF